MFKSALLASVMAITTRAINLDTENQLELYAENDLDLNNAIDAESSDSSSNSGRRRHVAPPRGLGNGRRNRRRLGNGRRNRRRGSSSSGKRRAPPKAPAPPKVVVEVEEEVPLKIEPLVIEPLAFEPYKFPKFDFNKLPHFGKIE